MFKIAYAFMGLIALPCLIIDTDDVIDSSFT